MAVCDSREGDAECEVTRADCEACRESDESVSAVGNGPFKNEPNCAADVEAGGFEGVYEEDVEVESTELGWSLAAVCGLCG